MTQNRTAIVALTAMRNYDNYTFTHMVNVAILTMGQARALGIDGRLLREFGLSALMHDIGKVRTPKDILNKPDKLSDDEFEIMRRHTVDGAEILRQTPEMPMLAPVVAFEHHLRLDGTGYPVGAKREHVESRHDAVQHLGRLRRHALASRLPGGVSDRSDPGGAEAERRAAVRPAPGPPVRPAARDLPAGQPRAAQHRRDRGRAPDARAGSLPAAGPGAVSPPMAPAGGAARSQSVRPGRVAPSSRSSARSIRPTSASIRSRSWIKRLLIAGGYNFTGSHVRRLRTLLVAAGAIGAGLSLPVHQDATIPVSSPERLVAELRLAQIAALMLTLVGRRVSSGSRRRRMDGPASGSTSPWRPASSCSCAYTMICDPRQALTLLALGFAAHAIIDVAHRPGVLPDGVAPRWYTVGCASSTCSSAPSATSRSCDAVEPHETTHALQPPSSPSPSSAARPPRRRP